MEDYWQSNYAIISRRWPELAAELVQTAAPATASIDTVHDSALVIDGAHLSSCYDRAQEARTQALDIPKESAQAWQYGLAAGELPCHLLERSALQALHIVPLSLPVLKAALSCFDHSAWLNDPRVHLHHPGSFSRVNKPFCVSGACLRLAEESYHRLRDQLILELTTEHINQRFVYNAKFQKQLQSNISRIEQDYDAAELFQSAQNATAYIVVPGPTLGEHYERLRSRQAGSLLIAVDAALKPLMMQGITPDIVVSIDGNRDTILRCYDVDLGLLKRSLLIYFPIVHADVLELWPGKRYVAYSSSPIYEDLRERIKRGMLYASGSVLHPAVDLAVKMGCKRIELLGADFGFPDDQAYVAGSAVASAYSVKDRAEALVKDGSGRDIRTTRQFRGYQLDLEAYIESHPEVSFINGSKRGARILGTTLLQSSL